MFYFCRLELPNNIFLAPMAGVTTRPFRAVAHSMGCGLAWTEMISAEGLVRGDKKTRDFLPAREEPGKVAVQLFGHRPETLRDAALMAEETSASMIDINMGCPVRKIVKGGAGAALLRDPPAIRRILEAVCAVVRKPVSVKIRSGWDERSVNAVEVARIAAGSGAAALVLHGRTARQGFSGRANWELIAEVAREAEIPVVGNGDLESIADAKRAIAASGCEAAMIGRAAMRPWVFRENSEAEREHQGLTREGAVNVMLRHLELSVMEFGERRGTILMRRPLAWYSRGYAGAGKFRRRVNGLDSPEEMKAAIADFARSEGVPSSKPEERYGAGSSGTVPSSATAASGT